LQNHPVLEELEPVGGDRLVVEFEVVWAAFVADPAITLSQCPDTVHVCSLVVSGQVRLNGWFGTEALGNFDCHELDDLKSNT
jgi:hypothetical protein